jgi:para-aminobenzoate synthetase component I
MIIEEFKQTLNRLGQKQVPFLFVIDFEMEKPLVWKMDEINEEEILFYLNGFSNAGKNRMKSVNIRVQKFPIDIRDYKKRFDEVIDRLSYGDSFLTNLTIKTEIKIDSTLKELFYQSHAKYKFWLKDKFLFFSPEIFIQIRNGKISSFPMKGTITAEIPDAREIILSDRKELAEHVTMVDLIRNDLSQVASNVEVKRFRYIDEIKTTESNLLQVSSEVTGDLKADYQQHIGDLIVSLLPAGSITGAPKEKTMEIIKCAEREKRGYYSGVMGYFDGINLDSCVMIRFIEQQGEQLYFRSGGGITTQSRLESEYQEAISKVYVAVD